MNPNSKIIKTLERLLKLQENKECADCRSKAPRWASINLGIFICLQCSGIHRSLGVHISKVRSITLDTWLPEQVSHMQSMGNKRSNAYWEAELPLHYDRGQIENFIRAKYVEGRWIAKDCNVKPSSKSKQELIPSRRSLRSGSDGLTSSRSSRVYDNNNGLTPSRSSRVYDNNNGLTPSRSSRVYGNNGLTSSRSSRRFGSIAEWTNSQHLFKERRDCSVDEKDRSGSNPGADEVPKGCTYSKDQHQHWEKKENCQPQAYMDRSADTNLRNVNGKPPKESTQVVRSLGANGSLPKSEEGDLKIKPSIANPSPKADYADELFRTLCVENSVGIASSHDTNEWVRFDSDQESSTPEAKSYSNSAAAKATQEVELSSRSAASNISTELKKEDTKTAMVSFTTEHLNEHLNEVINNEKSLPKKMQNSQPVKSSVSSAPYNMSSLDRPAAPFKGVTSLASAQQPSAALPVSGYDYDFSFLTKGMFKKR